MNDQQRVTRISPVPTLNLAHSTTRAASTPAPTPNHPANILTTPTRNTYGLTSGQHTNVLTAPQGPPFGQNAYMPTAPTGTSFGQIGHVPTAPSGLSFPQTTYMPTAPSGPSFGQNGYVPTTPSGLSFPQTTQVPTAPNGLSLSQNTPLPIAPSGPTSSKKRKSPSHDSSVVETPSKRCKSRSKTQDVDESAPRPKPQPFNITKECQGSVRASIGKTAWRPWMGIPEPASCKKSVKIDLTGIDEEAEAGREAEPEDAQPRGLSPEEMAALEEDIEAAFEDDSI